MYGVSSRGGDGVVWSPKHGADFVFFFPHLLSKGGSFIDKNDLFGYRIIWQVLAHTEWSISSAGSANLMRVAVHSLCF